MAEQDESTSGAATNSTSPVTQLLGVWNKLRVGQTLRIPVRGKLLETAD